MLYNPEQKFVLKNQRISSEIKSIKVYEAHVCMSSVNGRVAQYREFADQVLPRIVKLGYNCVQLMAIQEHAYYGSFGYQVTNFFATSSRQVTPDDFKYLKYTVHVLGLRIIIDIVHSHASNNFFDDINRFDGTDHCY